MYTCVTINICGISIEVCFYNTLDIKFKFFTLKVKHDFKFKIEYMIKQI